MDLELLVNVFQVEGHGVDADAHGVRRRLLVMAVGEQLQELGLLATSSERMLRIPAACSVTEMPSGATSMRSRRNRATAYPVDYPYML